MESGGKSESGKNKEEEREIEDTPSLFFLLTSLPDNQNAWPGTGITGTVVFFLSKNSPLRSTLSFAV